MRPFKFEISTTDEFLVSTSGLALAGVLLEKTNLKKRLGELMLGDRKRPEISHADVVRSMLGLLVVAKPDFDAITAFSEDEFFRSALFLKDVPSAPTLRQRIDQLAGHCDEIILEESVDMVARHAPVVSPCYQDLVPLDIDVSPFDNSKTRKEGVSRTYKEVDGYAPIFAYLGTEGYLVNCDLRVGKQHCQDGTPEFLGRSLELARKVTKKPLLVRMDAGNDALDNLELLRKEKVDYIIKRNLRKEKLEDWLIEAQAFGEYSEPREGKTVYTGSIHRELGGRMWRVVFKVTERTIDAKGQAFLVPEVEVDTYWTSLKIAPEDVIALYEAHGTSEQFHSELKTDMDLERLPSGKFATNALVLRLGLMAYNILRLCGQTALKEDRDLPPSARAPLRKPVKRRRLRSVIQDMIYMACRFTSHARRLGLALWRANPWGPIWERVYFAFTGRL